MKVAFLTIILVTVSLVYASAAEPKYAENTVVVRFSPTSQVGNAWISAGRTGQIDGLSAILGSNTTRGYLGDNTLAAVTKAQSERDSYNVVPQGALHPLARIAVIVYDRDMHPLHMAAKLRSLPDLIYAEPLPLQEIIGVPNDPLAVRQYHLIKVRATEAWDELPPSRPIVVGIVDTGIDTTHPDLQENIWKNPGETGIDGNGIDRRVNGVDDDGNGFIDDWFGWDFAGSDGEQQDNTPLPGHAHGTHVGGLVAAVINNAVGVAGVAPNVKLIPIKVGVDNPNARSVTRTSEGILYAAAVGADVINCSFGSSSPSFADLDVVNAATDLGALIIGAAGNDGVDRAFYPAAHPVVLSIAATDSNDDKAVFSNVHSTVDVSAPGWSILSTTPGNNYEIFDGTSMSAPIVAAVAAMAKMTDVTMEPGEIHALIKANADNIDAFNISFIGRMGTGRVNALKTIRRTNSKYVELFSSSVTDADGDGIFSPGDQLLISITAINRLDGLIDCRIEAIPAPSTVMPILDVSTADLGAMAKDEQKAASNDIVVTIPMDAPLNARLSLNIVFTDGKDDVGRHLIRTVINPSYRTINENDVSLTVNSVGNIGYNDYPNNDQGVGVRYRNGPSLTYESAFLIGSSPTYLPNVARSADPNFRDNSFELTSVVSIRRDSVLTGARAVTYFDDSIDPYGLGLSIKQTVYSPTADSMRASYIVAYDIHNPSDTTVPDLRAALFMDWDLSPAGSDDGCAWDHARGIGFVQNTRNPNAPTVGVSLLSPLIMNFFAIDNAGGQGHPGIYDHFLRAEKWFTMSSGIERTNSSITDVSMMIGGGPFSLAPGGTRQVVFAVSLGIGFDAVAEQMAAVRNAAIDFGLDAVQYDPEPLTDRILYVEGGPAVHPGTSRLLFEIHNPSPVRILIVDMFGRTIRDVLNDFNVHAGRHERVIEIPSAATGVYFITMETSP